MSDQNPLQDLLTEMARVRAEKGEDAWRLFCQEMVGKIKDIGPQGVKVAQSLFGDTLDLSSVSSDPPVKSPSTDAPPKDTPPSVGPFPSDLEAGKAFVEAVRSGLPSVQTQAEYDAIAGAFGAMRNAIAAILVGDKEKAAKSDETLLLALQAVKLAKSGSDKLRDVPEAATSPAAESFKRPPRQFGEEDVQKQLLNELDQLQSLPDLKTWYESTKSRRSEVMAPSLRNPLFDAIRSKNRDLSE